MSYIVIEKTDEKNFANVERMIAFGGYRTYPTLEQARKRGRAFLSTNKKRGFVIILEDHGAKTVVGDYVGVMSWTDGGEYYPHDAKLAKLHTGYAYNGIKSSTGGFVDADGRIRATFKQVNDKTLEYNKKKYDRGILGYDRRY